jgi:hypothetical protein
MVQSSPHLSPQKVYWSSHLHAAPVLVHAHIASPWAPWGVVPQTSWEGMRNGSFMVHELCVCPLCLYLCWDLLSEQEIKIECYEFVWNNLYNYWSKH